MNKIYVANWKMYFTSQQEIAFLTDNLAELTALSKTNTLIMCPSFLSLVTINTIIKNTPINLGAQNCSTKDDGPYTGEVSAKSLAEVGCHYCIIGHSERRAYAYETTSIIKEKLDQTSTYGITPIICIGETDQEKNDGKTKDILKEQLIPLITALTPRSSILIAYEPVWAIGSGIVSTPKLINEACATIATIMHHAPTIHYKILYGGSIQSTHSAELKKTNVDGFLIGKASTDFQELKKIVS